MLKFIIKIGICIIFLSSVNFLFKNTNYWKTENDVYKFKSIPPKIDIGTLGSSHAQLGVNFGLYPNIQAFNFALSQQSFSYDYNLLTHYIHHFNKNAVLFIPVSYFSFRQSQKSIDEIKNRYYRILPVKLIYNSNYIEKIQYGILPVLSAGKKLKYIIYDSPENEINIFEAPYLQKSVDTNAITHIAYAKIESWENEVSTSDTMQIAQNIAYLEKIIDLCIMHNLTPILVTFPVIATLYNLYPKDKKEEFYKTIYTVAQKRDVRYIDFSNDVRFISNELFFDSDHLNYAGSKILTEILLEIAQSYLN